MKCLICQNTFYPFLQLLQKRPNPFFEVCESCFKKTPLLLTISSVPTKKELCDVYQYHVDNEMLHKIYHLYEGFWLQHLIHMKYFTILFIEGLDKALLEMISDFNFGRMIIVTPTIIEL